MSRIPIFSIPPWPSLGASIFELMRCTSMLKLREYRALANASLCTAPPLCSGASPLCQTRPTRCDSSAPCRAHLCITNAQQCSCFLQGCHTVPTSYCRPRVLAATPTFGLEERDVARCSTAAVVRTWPRPLERAQRRPSRPSSQ